VIMKKASDGSTIPVIVECNTRWHLCNFLPYVMEEREGGREGGREGEGKRLTQG